MKNLRTPRTLAECSFDVGYPVVSSLTRPPRTMRVRIEWTLYLLVVAAAIVSSWVQFS